MNFAISSPTSLGCWRCYGSIHRPSGAAFSRPIWKRRKPFSRGSGHKLASTPHVAVRAVACSVWKMDSADDLVGQADAIYLVEARDFAQSPPVGRHPAGTVRFSVSETLKGEQRSDLRVPGVFVDQDDYNDMPVPYKFVRPEGRHGSCYAEAYRKGGMYLLFVKAGTPHWSPLAPVNEQVTSESDNWVKWVRQHLRFTEALRRR